MEKLINVENYWSGDVDCPEVMEHCCHGCCLQPGEKWSAFRVAIC